MMTGRDRLGLMQGVPVRIEVGPRDVDQGTCVAARRDRPGKEGKQFGVPLDPRGFVGAVQKLLDEVQVFASLSTSLSGSQCMQ